MSAIHDRLETSESMTSSPLDMFSSTEFRDLKYSDEPLFTIPVPADSSMFSAFQILLNTAIGSGTLMVPYTFNLGIGTAVAVSAVFALISYFALHFMTDAAFYAKEYDYRGLFAHTFGQKNLWIVNVMILLVQFGASMIYAHWNGRLINKILGIAHPLFGSNAFWAFLVECFVIFPLACFRSIAKLESIAIISTFFIILLIVHAAYWFIKDIAEDKFRPEGRISWFNFNRIVITALSVNAMAYNCHINLFPCLEHLKNCTVKRARQLAWLTIGACFILYNMFGLFTYFHFFDIGEGSALEFYPMDNWFTVLTTVGVCIVLICCAPLVIWAARNSLNDMIFKGSEPTETRWVTIGGVLCLLSGFLASTSDNVILFFDVVGGLFTPTIVFFMPAIFYLRNCPNLHIVDRGFALIVCLFTVIAAIACTYHVIIEILEKAHAAKN